MRIQPLTLDHRGGSTSERWWGGGASLTLSPKSLILRPELQSAALHFQSCYTPAYVPPSAPFPLPSTSLLQQMVERRGMPDPDANLIAFVSRRLHN